MRSRYFAAGVLSALTAAPLLAATSSEPPKLMTVVNGELPGTTFRTTVELRNSGTAPADCRFEYRSAKRPAEPLVSIVAVPPGRPTVMDEFSRELPVATTMRVRCTTEVEIYSRLHTSANGGATYSKGRLFRAVAATPIAAGGEKSVETSADLIIAETSGRPASVAV